MLGISWTAKKSNQTVLRKADETRSLINRMHKCQAFFSGHVISRKKICLTTVKMEKK